MSLIHILEGQEDIILDDITAKNILSDNHHQSLKDNLETFDFTTLADKRFSEHLAKRNRLIIPGEDGEYIEFVISESVKYRDFEGLKTDVYSYASYLDLKKAKIIYPSTLREYTPSTAVGWTLGGSEWRPGIIEGSGYRTFEIENHTNSFAFLKRIANEFNLELRFRVETDGNKVVGRFVDLLERVGEWRGREVEFGRDLIGIKRSEKQDIYTALIGLGPEREDGTRLEVLVEDEEALQRWGRPNEQGELQHLIGTYEPQSTRLEMTEEELTQYTRTELDKRIAEVVEYESDIADLENVPGMENKKIRFGDTIKIKDTKFNPPLYLEARVHTQDRSIKDKSKKKVNLGDYIEYTEDEVNAIWQSLQSEIRQKISHVELIEYTYDKNMIDDKDEYIFDEGKSFAEAVGIDAESYAETVSDQAERNAKGHADTVASEAESSAKSYAEDQSAKAVLEAKAYAVAQEAYDNKMQEIANDLGDKAEIEYVDGQLVDKANVDDVYTIEDIDNRLLNYVGVTEYETDIDGIVQTLDSQSTQIAQNEEAIGFKADDSRVNALEGTVDDHSAQFLVMADEISSKVDATYVSGAIDRIEVGGRNLVPKSGEGHYDIDTLIWSGDRGRSSVVVKDGMESIYYAGHDYFRISSIPTKIGHTYTWSLYIRTEDGDSGSIRWSNYSGGHYNYETYEIADNWIRISKTFVAEHSSDLPHFRLQDDSLVNNGIYVANIQLQEGNKATDWTLALEDIDAEFSNQQSLIEQKADSVTVQAVETSVDTLTGRVDTAEASITTMSNQIQSKVEENDVRSIFTQEANSFTFNADQINFDGHVFGGDATFSGRVEGGSIRSNTTIDVTTDLKVGNNIYIGGEDSTDQKGIILYKDNFREVSIYANQELDTGMVDVYGVLWAFHSDLNVFGEVYSEYGFRTNDGQADIIVEQGSNVDGHYIRYANGIQICWHTISSMSVNTSTATFQGTTYFRAGQWWDFPMPFIQNPAVSYEGSVGSQTLAPSMRRVYNRSNSRVYCQTVSVDTFSSLSDISYFAIGRWR